MFCRQCEQTAKGTGCTIQGVCGKDETTAVLQDALLYALKGISVYANLARGLGVKDAEVDLFLIEGLFTTVTNVDFDPEHIRMIIDASRRVKDKIKKQFLEGYKKKYGKEFFGALPAAASWKPAATMDELMEQARVVGILAGDVNDDLRSLRELILYGLKGMAAYADHARILGKESEEVNAFFPKAMAALVDDRLSADDLTAMVMELGKVNLACMELLDKAHTERFGHPLPTEVSLTIKKGPAIIVSGHDLYDLEQLLIQTQGKGINIYTHGEMLPAHGYPGLRKYTHLSGHFGSAWQNQQKEFDAIPAVILMTTNCIQKPKDSYKDRIFTTGLVAWPRVEHVDAVNGVKDFSRLINKALELGGFSEGKKDKAIMVGFAHNAVLALADKVIAAVKAKQIRHFFLIGGCDGAKPGRNYYTEFAQKVPADCLILTLACGKFRFNKLDFGFIGDLPRLLDCGQCNDAYSAIAIASGLAKAFNCEVNDLPLSLVLSWYEQKAVCILITLLSLGIKNIRLGPSLPAFVSPNLLNILVEKFDIRPVTTADEDMKAILG
ncbi:MAG: hydroxylamine reductase [Candidatus Omnitrophica bacterium]|nr:hydroxylamine reductase [Candidatus Omnitrophota bacterium]MBU4479767.1 hydroxylamine reductase [Candidatus Omnitrophota bacterium]MCG2703290.1 hydroxylamine reductase [Candidatus Omnitrophota bacterium]